MPTQPNPSPAHYTSLPLFLKRPANHSDQGDQLPHSRHQSPLNQHRNIPTHFQYASAYFLAPHQDHTHQVDQNALVAHPTSTSDSANATSAYAHKTSNQDSGPHTSASDYQPLHM